MANHAERTTVTFPSDREILSTRYFDAPRELVWKAWTSPELLARWFGPTGFTLTTNEHSVKPGGKWRFVFHGPDGRDYHNLINFLEVDEPSRLVYKHGEDENTEPIKMSVTIEFTSVGKGTQLTMRTMFVSKEARDFALREYGAGEGAKQTLARLADLLDGTTDAMENGGVFVIRRVFKAPLETVWNAWTKPELLARWFGPRGVTIPNCSMDLRVGGTFHYHMEGANVDDHWGLWIFHEITPPSRMVFTVSFADENGTIIRAPFDENWPLKMLSTVTFEPHAGIGRGTVVTVRWQAHEANEVERKTFREGMEGMQQGWSGTLDKLVDYLAGSNNPN